MPIGLEQGDGEHALEPPTGAIPPDCVARFGLGEFAWVALVKGADDQPRHDHGQQDRQTGLGGADSALTPAEDDRRQRQIGWETLRAGWESRAAGSSETEHEVKGALGFAREGLVGEVGVDHHVLFGGDFVVGGELGRRRTDGVHEPGVKEDLGLNARGEKLDVDVAEFSKMAAARSWRGSKARK